MKSPENASISLYLSGRKQKFIVITGLTILLFCASIYALNAGSYHLSFDRILTIVHQAVMNPDLLKDFPSEKTVVIDFRMPRVLLAIFTGISLAIAGCVMQALLRNPLVSPFTLGLSSAASFGAALAIVFGASLMPFIPKEFQNGVIIFSAFLLGWFSILFIYAISQMKGSSSATLILAGVVIGYIFTAGVMILKYLTNDEKLREITLWLMGGMWGANWGAIIIVAPISLLCFLYLESKAWDLNTLSAGDDVAKNLGVNVNRLRLTGLFVSTLAASACLAFTGIIGFIGLMGPHIGRMLIGNDNRFLIPCSALLGALILLISDTAARTIMDPVEIPVGVIMYVIGGIFFMFLILRGKHRMIT
ncbi:transport system permease protein [Methanospirillum hungatei JF-1]|jgi:iron complex transport system permease protein|uniref:Cobalamin import system permease protein BtuC n=1 Tax=Methanospirillum hungatei JF-1 (strain ATCC 27890 / DSM 864 / NBRC 100397 / JF-1) TaxID=323259 RepID=Q2FMY0_METHJ|nr:iron ABC transporter permease [Methanospirillum hungatei]ABD40061.1 transport system permease protein [Methanospirillum hungatei JF-1]